MSQTISLVSSFDKKKAPEFVIIPMCENKSIHLEKAVMGIEKQVGSIKSFSAKKGEVIELFKETSLKAEHVYIAGLGKSTAVTSETLRMAVGKAIKKAVSKEVKTVTVVVPDPKKIKPDMESVFTGLIEGASLANDVFNDYKSQKKEAPVTAIKFLTQEPYVEKYTPLVERVEIVCEGTKLARKWVSIPSADKAPDLFSKLITEALEDDALKLTVLDEAALKKNKMNALLGVAQGSENRPCMVIADYNPGRAKKTVMLVGKGVTFDSGGLNLKPGASMLEMKMDMAGAAATAASMWSIARLKPKYRVVALMPLVENMPSGTAYRPGDILKSMSGKTIEIGNTDAEGRLALCDAITYGIKNYQPDYAVDFATLTGACIIALGEKIAGVFSNNDALSQAITDAGDKTGEACWQMPMPENYKEMLKSSFADMVNVGPARWGGAITAALFLSEFVGKTSWAHVDIAGPAYNKKGDDICLPGGTGFGVRLFCELLSGKKQYKL